MVPDSTGVSEIGPLLKSVMFGKAYVGALFVCVVSFLFAKLHIFKDNAALGEKILNCKTMFPPTTLNISIAPFYVRSGFQVVSPTVLRQGMKTHVRLISQSHTHTQGEENLTAVTQLSVGTSQTNDGGQV